MPEGGSFILGAALATFGSGNAPSGELGTVVIQNYAPQLSNLAPGFDAATPLDTNALNALGVNDPNNILANTTVPAVPLSTGGFANVAVTEDKTQGRGLVVAQGTTLAVQAGWFDHLQSDEREVSILGSLIAPSGDISVSSNSFLNSTTNDIVVGPDAVISVAGQWINDDSLYANTAGATTYVNGGSITLSTTDAVNLSGADATGSILLAAAACSTFPAAASFCRPAR